MRLTTRLLCVLALALIAWPLRAPAQLEGDAPIFRRFSSPPQRRGSGMYVFEVPVRLRPQTDPGALVKENLGLGVAVASNPFSRTFVTIGFDFGRMRWQPSDPGVASAEVRQVNIYQAANYWIARRFVFSFGYGLGMMDSLVLHTDRSFEHKLLPYIPVRMGLSVSLWDKALLGAQVTATPFFGQGWVTGQTRALLSLGWVY